MTDTQIVEEWRSRAVARENFPWGSIAEQRERLAVVGSDTRRYLNEFFSHPRRHPGMLLLLGLALIGIAGDALTTYTLVQLPYFSESNAVAKGLMDFVGISGYTVIAVLAGLLTTLLLFVRGPNVIAWVLFGGGVTIVLFKLLVTGSNTLTFVAAVLRYS